MSERVPALVVSGFLGSGKTSLVRHLLAEARRSGQRVAVISNEFGELGIDRALLGEGDEAFVELEGGCVCCELSDDLVKTLQMLRERVAPDRVIVETSGIALPYDTQLHFWREPVSHWIGDDMSVVVVNAEQVAGGYDLEGTFEDQVSSADLLLLNQVDRVAEAALEGIESTLRALEPDAPIVRCQHGRVDEAVFFPPETQAVRAARATEGSDREGDPHSHERFSSEELRVTDGIELGELETLVRGPGVLRAKGFVRTSQGVRLVQLVGARLDLEEVDADDRAGIVASGLLNRVVVIRRAE